jgi:HK97 family phage prohead protease
MAYNILARDGRPVKKDGDPVKAMDVTVEKIEQLDDKEKSFIAVASTEDEDRDKDIIRQDGWNLKNFKKNPMVPWSHDYWAIPVAKSLRTWVDKTAKKLMFKPQFDADDDQSMKIYNKYKNGFLTSFSVGFRGIDFDWRDEENRWSGGMEFMKQELLEISAVTVPANPNATVLQNDLSDDQKNLLQLGYVPLFAKTESGLFYPIREQFAEYRTPEVVDYGDGSIQTLFAYDNDEQKVAVGYYFDPEKWSTDDIKNWITENNEPTYKQFYYNFVITDDEEKQWEIDVKDEEVEIPEFDEPKVLTSEDVPSEDDVEPDVCPAPLDKDDEKSQEEIILELGKAIEEMISTQMFKMAEGLATGFDQVFDKILVELDGIKKLINEKGVDSTPEIDDNDSDKSKSKTDDEIEIDDSLISPDDDKSNSDEVIEIDDDALETKEVAKTVDSVFRQKLREIFNLEKEDKINIKP